LGLKGRVKIAKTLKELIRNYSNRLFQIPEDVASKKPTGKWSKKEYIGHLLDSASNNHGYQNIVWSELIKIWKVTNTLLVYRIENVTPNTLSNSMTIGGGTNYFRICY